MREMIEINELTLDDVSKMVEIYTKVTGKKNMTEEKMSEKIDYGQCLTAVGAFNDSVLVGFIIGDVTQDSFGLEEQIGWINMVGVDPEFNKLGVGKMLGKELLNRFKGLGTRQVRTIVQDKDEGLYQYFLRLGMNEASWKVLESKL